jgi:hypothetical protein
MPGAKLRPHTTSSSPSIEINRFSSFAQKKLFDRQNFKIQKNFLKEFENLLLKLLIKTGSIKVYTVMQIG